jgi:hypothetical protein
VQIPMKNSVGKSKDCGSDIYIYIYISFANIRFTWY